MTDRATALFFLWLGLLTDMRLGVNPRAGENTMALLVSQAQQRETNSLFSLMDCMLF
jgi:hypothetical protein